MSKTTMLFDVDNAEILAESPDSQFATAKITAFSTGRTRHDTICDIETLKRTAPTIYEKPIVFEYDDLLGDFGTHSRKPIISGFIVPDSATYFEREDGRTSMSVQAKIWKRYAPKFINIFRGSRDAKKKVSVELEVLDYEKTSDGLTKLKDWAYSAVCVLGEFVTEASPGAEMQMISFAEEENKQYENVYQLEFGGRYKELDFSIPDGVKTNAQSGLDLRKKYNRGGTTVGLTTARYLLREKVATPEKVRHIAKYFPRHANDNLDDKTSNGWIAWQLWGGDSGRRWSASLVFEMDKLDEKEMSYFAGGEEEMPYKNIEDANPAIRGINPPVSLSQANAIAKQAESIGQDDEKNGWAIAISNFKKSHKVEDGKWVKKEKEVSGEKSFSEDEAGKTGAENSKEEDDKNHMAVVEEKKQEAEVKEEDKAENVEEKEMALPENEEKEEKKEEDSKFSYAGIFASEEDMAKMFADDEDDDEETKEDFAKAKEEFSKGENPAVMMKGMARAFSRAGRKMEAMAKENEELKKFKSDVDEQKKEFAVNKTIGELSDKFEIPQEKIAEMKELASALSYDNIEAWKRDVKALAVDFAVKTSGGKKDDEIVLHALPFDNTKPAHKDDVWAVQ